MSGANTPRSKKRIRQALIDMMRDYQKGKPISPIALKVLDRMGVLDGLFPPEILITQRPKGAKGLGRYAEVELEEEEDEVVRKLRDEIAKRRGDGNSNS